MLSAPDKETRSKAGTSLFKIANANWGPRRGEIGPGVARPLRINKETAPRAPAQKTPA